MRRNTEVTYEEVESFFGSIVKDLKLILIRLIIYLQVYMLTHMHTMWTILVFTDIFLTIRS